MPGVYIVILNYKRWEDTRDCLRSVFQSDFRDFKVIVVDNDSRDNSLQHLMEWTETYLRLPNNANDGFRYYDCSELSTETDPRLLPVLTFIQNDKNAGFASGNNLALKLLLKDDAYVWLLNPDMVIQENTLGELVNFAEQQGAKSIIGSVIKSYEQPQKMILYGGAKINFNSATISLVGDPEDISRLDFICGGSLFTHTRHLKDIGLLPEEYFLYWEETDWCYQARKKGYTMKVCPTAICYDKISTAIGKSYLGDYYYTLNGLLFVNKHKKNKVPLVIFFAYLRSAKRMLLLKPERARGVLKAVQVFLKRKKI